MMRDLRAMFRTALEENAVTDPVNQGLHGWRCKYPEAYGPCQCVDDLIEDLVAVVITYQGDEVVMSYNEDGSPHVRALAGASAPPPSLTGSEESVVEKRE